MNNPARGHRCPSAGHSFLPASMTMLNLPPGLGSISQAGVDTPLGLHRFATVSGSVHALQTAFLGASNVCLIVSSILASSVPAVLSTSPFHTLLIIKDRCEPAKGICPESLDPGSPLLHFPYGARIDAVDTAAAHASPSLPYWHRAGFVGVVKPPVPSPQNLCISHRPKALRALQEVQ